MARCLKTINRSMSTFDTLSELSRFNAKQDLSVTVISKHFYTVLTQAAHVSSMSGGAWDGTLKPIVDLWGFGPAQKPQQVPNEADIAKVKESIGFNKIKFFKQGRQYFIQKLHPHVTLDLGSIAKGYGVDAVADVLKKKLIRSFIVEVGGEVYVQGQKEKGHPWIVGVNYPEKNAALDAVFLGIKLKNEAVATSGDYRNWIELNGESFAHTIDPRSCHPLRNQVVSVSIIAPNCTLADGLSTAVIVLGPLAGLKMLEKQKGVSALIITRENTKFEVYTTPNFSRYISSL